MLYLLGLILSCSLCSFDNQSNGAFKNYLDISVAYSELKKLDLQSDFSAFTHFSPLSKTINNTIDGIRDPYNQLHDYENLLMQHHASLSFGNRCIYNSMLLMTLCTTYMAHTYSDTTFGQINALTLGGFVAPFLGSIALEKYLLHATKNKIKKHLLDISAAKKNSDYPYEFNYV